MRAVGFPRTVAVMICLLAAAQAVEAYAQLGSHTPASRYFSGRSGLRLPVQPTRRVAAKSQAMSAPNGQKPFQDIHRPSTISPYLSLDIVVDSDDGQALPNYYAFYRPQREQQQAVESQQAEIRRLQQQVRVAGANNELSRNAATSMPTTGNSSQFMNLGSYYPRLR